MRAVSVMAGLLLLAACGGAENATEATGSNMAAEPGNALDAGNLLDAGNSAETGSSAEAAPEDARPLVNLAPGALSFVDPNSGRARELAFGTERAMVERAVEAALGAPAERGSNGECEEGAMEFARMPGGLLLWFQQGKFAGWFLDARDGAKLTTASGIGIGSTRKELTGVYDADIVESTLGEEFIAGELSGLLNGREPTAKVTAIWSGQACNFR